MNKKIEYAKAVRGKKEKIFPIQSLHISAHESAGGLTDSIQRAFNPKILYWTRGSFSLDGWASYMIDGEEWRIYKIIDSDPPIITEGEIDAIKTGGATPGKKKLGKKVKPPTAWEAITDLLEDEIFFITQIWRHPMAHTFSITMMNGDTGKQIQILVLPSYRSGKRLKVQIKSAELDSFKFKVEREIHI